MWLPPPWLPSALLALLPLLPLLPLTLLALPPEHPQAKGLDTRDVDVPVIGGHAGETILPLISQVGAGGFGPTRLLGVIAAVGLGPLAPCSCWHPACRASCCTPVPTSVYPPALPRLQTTPKVLPWFTKEEIEKLTVSCKQLLL